MSQNYAINSNKPAFSVTDDDMESAFLQSSGGQYLANDRLVGSMAPKPYDNSQPQQEFQSTIQKIQDVEQRSLASTQRSLQAIAESEQIGVETAKDLVHQREQLQNTSKRLDNMDQDLKESQKNISAMKSVFSSIRQWITAPKESKNSSKGKSEVASPTSDGAYKEPNFDHNPKLEKAVNIAPQKPDPSLRLRGVDYSESSSTRYQGPASGGSDDWRDTTKRVNNQLDNDLEEMSFGLSRLRGLAEGLGQEIQDQNALLDTITTKADRTDVTLGSTNKQINAILKK